MLEASFPWMEPAHSQSLLYYQKENQGIYEIWINRTTGHDRGKKLLNVYKITFAADEVKFVSFKKSYGKNIL